MSLTQPGNFLAQLLQCIPLRRKLRQSRSQLESIAQGQRPFTFHATAAEFLARLISQAIGLGQSLSGRNHSLLECGQLRLQRFQFSRRLVLRRLQLGDLLFGRLELFQPGLALGKLLLQPLLFVF